MRRGAHWSRRMAGMWLVSAAKLTPAPGRTAECAGWTRGLLPALCAANAPSASCKYHFALSVPQNL
eukprot:2488383-Rhodomonas_salina.1